MESNLIIAVIIIMAIAYSIVVLRRAQNGG